MVCEKCWEDAGKRTFARPYKSHNEHYQDVLKEREGKHCTEEQQKYGNNRPDREGRIG